MSRFIPHRDMTTDQIIDTSYDVMALMSVAEAVARVLEENSDPGTAAALARLLALTGELYAPLHDALESHEGLNGGAS